MTDPEALLKPYADSVIHSFLSNKSSQSDEFLRPNNPPYEGFAVSNDYPTSIVNAIDIVESNPNQIGQVVQAIITRGLRGNDESILKLLDILRVQKEYKLAYGLSIYASQIFVNNGDIYAAEIESAIELTDALSAGSVIQRIIDSKYESCWSYRFGRAVCNFYWHIAKMNLSAAEKKKYVENGLSCARDLQMRNPKDEFGYFWEVELLWLIDPFEGARKLRRYVREAKPPPLLSLNEDSKTELSCPRCCELYIKRILSVNGQLAWQQIEECAIKGLADAFSLSFQELPPIEQAELSRLSAYFNNQIDRVTAMKKQSAALRKKQLQEVPEASNHSRNAVDYDENIINIFEE